MDLIVLLLSKCKSGLITLISMELHWNKTGVRGESNPQIHGFMQLVSLLPGEPRITSHSPSVMETLLDLGEVRECSSPSYLQPPPQ